MGIYIEGFGISGYRSFGKTIQRVGPLNKINIFAGQNNSGKSNIINYLIGLYPSILQSVHASGKMPGIGEIDRPINRWDGKIRVEIGIKHNGDCHKNLHTLPNLNANYIQWIDTILTSNILSKGTGVAWIPFQASANQNFSIPNETIDELAAKVLTPQQWQNLWMKVTNQGQGNIKQHWVPATLRQFVSKIVLPSISIIPSIRRYSQEKSDKPDDFSGLGIIDRLAKLQNPSYKEQKLKDSFSTPSVPIIVRHSIRII